MKVTHVRLLMAAVLSLALFGCTQGERDESAVPLKPQSATAPAEASASAPMQGNARPTD